MKRLSRASGSIVVVLALATLAGCASRNPNRPPPGQGNEGNGIGQVIQPSGNYGQGQYPNQGQQQRASGNGSQPGSPARPQLPPRNPAQASSPAVMSLLGSADTLAKAGHMDSAAATLERALDLEPRNPFVYQRLAAVRLAQGQIGQAEQLANKSNSVAGNNPFVEASNWRLIAEARRTGGDNQGAQQASARAVNYNRAASQLSQPQISQ